MYLDQKKILDSLTDEDIIKICAELGSPEYKRDSQGNLCFSTVICHNGDSPYKLVYYQNSKLFSCFTCGDTYGIIELVIRANRLRGRTLTWYKALYEIGRITGRLYEKDPEQIPSEKTIPPLAAVLFNAERACE